MRVAVEDETGAVAINHLRQTGGPEIRLDFRRLAGDGGGDRGIMQNDDALFGAQLG